MRKALVQAIYAWLMETDSPEEVLDHALTFHEVRPDDRERAHRLFVGVRAQRDTADSILARLLVHWSLDRLGQVERAVCHLALYELAAEGDVPAEVVIDEAVRLGKEYAGAEAAHFVNGLLDAAVSIVRPTASDQAEPA